MGLPTPYYHDERAGITIYHGDCRDILPLLEPGSVDLVLTDPPYNVGRKYLGADDSLADDEHQSFIAGWLPKALAIAECVLCTPGIVPLARYLRYSPKWILAWHKPFGIGHSPVGFNNWEPILLWGRAPLNGKSDYVYSPWVRDASAVGHDCPKPLPLFRKLIARFSLEAGLVIDPFMGSGTTLRAAKDLGRRCIGIEISEEYCRIAARRLSQEVMDLHQQEV